LDSSSKEGDCWGTQAIEKVYLQVTSKTTLEIQRELGKNVSVMQQ